MEIELNRFTPAEQATFRLRALYEQAGYRKYRASRFEEYALYQEYQRFLPDAQVITFTDLDGKLRAIKPDVTLSIAKTAQPAAGECKRFYYNEEVCRPSRESHTFQTIHQMGLESMGAVDADEQAAVVRLALQSLAALDVPTVLEISHMGYLTGLLDALHVPAEARAKLLDFLRAKNAHELRTAALAAGLEALFAAGFRQARPGEFTRRAFLNGRMDLTQAEAVIDLIDAETADAAANAAGQVAGAMRKRIDPVYDSWVDICAHFHAVLDYPDEDIDPFELSQLESALQASSRTLSALLSSCHRGRMVRSGVKITILGSPNAGKSSLLNALSGFDRVIVTDIPGTTRDTVEQTVTLGRHLVRLVDTAGIRDTEDVIEKIGVDRSVEAAKDCDAALFVVDDSRPLTDEDRRAMDAALEAPEAIAVLNKQDLGAVIEPSDLPFSYIVPVSCKDGTGFDLLEQAFDMLFPDDAPCDGSLLTNARQADAIVRAKKSVDAALRSLRAGFTPDAVLVDLEAAMRALGEVTGRTMREDITNRIFERFCVGK